MKTFGTVPELVIALRARTETQLRLVGLDGFEGSGKTTLGFALAAALDCPRFSSDCFIDTDSPHENYIGQLRLDQLERELRLALASFPVVVVDGVCLLEVLQAIGVQGRTTVTSDGRRVPMIERGTETSAFAVTAGRSSQLAFSRAP